MSDIMAGFPDQRVEVESRAGSDKMEIMTSRSKKPSVHTNTVYHANHYVLPFHLEYTSLRDGIPPLNSQIIDNPALV